MSWGWTWHVPEWIGKALAFFSDPLGIHHDVTPEEKADLVVDLHRYVLEVMEQMFPG